MATITSPPLYADTPLPLLSTPVFLTGKTDTFTLAASHMVLSHNALIRGYNGIYQHALRIPSDDYADFVEYCLAWHRCVEQHHMHEEENYFPAIGRAVGEEGVLESVAGEHGLFEAGLKEFKTYLLSLDLSASNNIAGFDAKHLLAIMESFSTHLHAHLESEPQAILALSRFEAPGKDIDLVKIEREEGMKAMTPGFAKDVLPVFLNNMESAEFEGGMWRGHLGGKRMDIRGMGKWRFLAVDGEGKRGRLVV